MKGSLSVKKTVLIMALLVMAAATWALTGRFPGSANAGIGSSVTAAPLSDKLPFQEIIFQLMGPLRYSALPAVLGSEAKIKIDFPKKTWTLQNFRRYDERGELLLIEGKYGLCAELAAYVFQRLKPLLGKRYILKFAGATEPEFFHAPDSNHIVLLLSDLHTGEDYLVDPSFHRYGKRAAFSGYKLYGIRDELDAIKRKERDVTLTVWETLPLVIRGDVLVILSVGPVGEVFDSQNISLAVAAHGRRGAGGEYLFLLRKKSGKEEAFRTAERMPLLLTLEEERRLKEQFAASVKGFGD